MAGYIPDATTPAGLGVATRVANIETDSLAALAFRGTPIVATGAERKLSGDSLVGNRYYHQLVVRGEVLLDTLAIFDFHKAIFVLVAL